MPKTGLFLFFFSLVLSAMTLAGWLGPVAQTVGWMANPASDLVVKVKKKKKGQ